MSARIERWFGLHGRRGELTCAAAAAMLLTAAGTARGQTARSFEDLQAKGLLAVGQTVAVEDVSGKTFRGTVDALSDGSLTLRMDSARHRTERVFSEADVSRIKRGRSNVIALSALTGAGAGFALAAAGAAAYGANEGGSFCGGCLAYWSTVTVPVGAGIGALVGLAIHTSTVKTIYAAPGKTSSLSIAPVVGKQTLGGVASIRF